MKYPLSAESRRSLEEIVAVWAAGRRSGDGRPPPSGDGRPPLSPGADGIEVIEAEVLLAGRPALLDVVARVGDHLAHAVLGLRRPDDELRLLRPADEPVFGLFDDGDGSAMVVDALNDSELAPLVLEAIVGPSEEEATPALVDASGNPTVLSFGDRCTLSVLSWLEPGPHSGIELLTLLDDVGFNHVAAPLAVWRRGGWDLGVVQERLSGSVDGWALALTSLRDLFATGGSPDRAGGDFGPESAALGTMTARLHLALDRARGQRLEPISGWVDAAVERVRQIEPELLDVVGVPEALALARRSELSAPALMTSCDIDLGRTARTDHGWVLSGCLSAGQLGGPGGETSAGMSSPPPPSVLGQRLHPPLADVARFSWSLHRVAAEAAIEWDAGGRSGTAELAKGWEARNRRSFIAGYLMTPDIGMLLPGDRSLVRSLLAVFELEARAVTVGWG